MSRQLVFWKYEGDTYLDNQKVYESISNMDTIEGLFKLPIEDILERISLVFYKSPETTQQRRRFSKWNSNR